MNWYTLRRARGAIILILVGVVFLLQETHILRWGHGWPVILIGLGIILLAERLIPQPPVPPPPPYPGQYPPYGYTGYEAQPPYSNAPYGSTPYNAGPFPPTTPGNQPPPSDNITLSR